jgi:hypothetical protein
MSVERSGQAIDVETIKGQLETGGARRFLTEGGSSHWMARAG